MARYTPEFLAALQRRYEQTDQPLRLIVAEFGIGMTTLQTLGQKHGWKKRSHRARDLRPASRVIDDVIALADEPAVHGAHRQTGSAECSPPPCGEGLGVGVIASNEGPPPRLASLADPPHKGEGEKLRDAALDRLEAFLLRRLDAEQAAYDRNAQAGDSAAGERCARTIGLTIRALNSLRELRGEAAPPQATETSIYDDDMPADIDEFRRELARRIDEFVKGEAQSEDDRAGEDPAVVAEV